MGLLVDEVMSKNNQSNFWSLAILMTVSYAATGLFHFVEEFSSDHISERVYQTISIDLFNKIQREDSSFFRAHTPAELMSRCTYDAKNVGFSYGFCLIYLFECLGVTTVMTIALLLVSPFVGLVPLVLLPLIAFITIRIEKKADPILDQISDWNAELNTTASQAINGIRTVKSFNSEELEVRKLNRTSIILRDLNTALDKNWAYYNVAATLSRVLLFLTLLLASILCLTERLSLGDFTSVFQYTNQLTWPVMEMGWIVAMLAQGRTAFKKVRAILEKEESIKDGGGKLDSSSGEIRFENISLSIDGKDLLKDISFEIKEGKSLAIMGETGSGKSLIANLATRFIDPSEGMITINGKDIRSLDLKEVRGFTSFVSQDLFLFSDTVRNNIAITERSEDIERIKEVSRLSSSHVFVENLENGYETIIGERGTGLSGGQKQRLTIARALMKNSTLLILDDATSALDMETERKVQKSIKEMKNRSLLIIAHRISAVRHADEILYMKDGKIVERGTHESLLKKQGLYYETYIAQYPEGEKDEE